jgi:hypothetical protein
VYRPPQGPVQLLVPGSFSLVAYALATGEKLWWVNGLAFEMKATPVIHEGVAYIHGTSSSQFEDSYDQKIPPFAELVSVHDKDRNRRFAPDEIPDVLARRWLKLMDLDADGELSEGEWGSTTALRAARREDSGRSASAAAAT